MSEVTEAKQKDAHEELEYVLGYLREKQGIMMQAIAKAVNLDVYQISNIRRLSNTKRKEDLIELLLKGFQEHFNADGTPKESYVFNKKMGTDKVGRMVIIQEPKKDNDSEVAYLRAENLRLLTLIEKMLEKLG